MAEMQNDDPMPVFVLKGKDQLALYAIEAYATRCEDEGLDEQVEQVRLALDEIEQWQARNPGLVKLPDHPHVPVHGGSAPIG